MKITKGVFQNNKSKYKKVGVLPIRIVWSNVSSIDPSSEREKKGGGERFSL